MFNPGPWTKCTKTYNNLSAKFAWIKKKVRAEKNSAKSLQFFWKTTENIFRQILFSRNENLIFDAISNSGKRRVTPKLKFSLPPEEFPRGSNLILSVNLKAKTAAAAIDEAFQCIAFEG